MNNELIILLEWFRANGIVEFFNNDLTNYCTEQNLNKEIISATTNKNFENVVETLVKKQNNIQQNSSLIELIYNIQNICDNINNIEDLNNFLYNYEDLNIIKKLSNNTIFYNGSIKSDILIINDFPTENDDTEGNVFSGEANILMDKMLKAIELSNENCCFLNSFFWRLAGNRIPIKEEFDLCKPFIEKFIALMKPKLIIFMGNYSLNNLTTINNSLIKTRGQFFDYTNTYLLNKIRAIATFGPNFLIKNIIKKKEVWEDLLNIKAFINNS